MNTDNSISIPSQTELTNLLNNTIRDAKEIYFVHDHRGRFVYANQAALKSFRLTEDNIIGKSWCEIGIPEQISINLDKKLEQALITVEAQTSELTIKFDDDQHVVEQTLYPHRNNAGEVTYVVTIMRDISTRKSIELEMVRSKDQLRSLLEYAPTAIVITDRNGIIKMVNSTAECLFGYSHKELLNASIEILLPDRFRSKHLHHREDFIISSGYRRMGLNLELFAQYRDGREFPVDVGISTVVNNDEVSIITYIVDITDRKLAEQALKEVNQRLNQSLSELEQQNQSLILLSELGDLLYKCNYEDEAYNIISTYTGDLFPACNGALYIATSDEKKLQLVSTWNNLESLQSVIHEHDCLALQNEKYHIANQVESNYCPHLIRDTSDSTFFSVCVPMHTQGNTAGVFHLRSDNLEIPDRLIRIAMMLTETIKMSLSNIRLREKLRMESIHDNLTGLYNRRYLDESLTREISRAKRYKRSFGLVMLDIDYFKSINDQYGHLAGDSVLVSVGQYLLSNLRTEDIACRFGGEEILIILPDSTKEQSYRFANKISQGVNNLKIRYSEQPLPSITLSLGVAVFPDHGENETTLLSSVDKALYLAKSSGRNKIIAANG